MDPTRPLPRKDLFKTSRVTSKHSQTAGRSAGYKKNDMTSKMKLQFEHDLEISLKSFEKKIHLQRLENLRHLAEKLKEDAWMYPDLDAKLGKSMSSCDPIILSYENCLLRQSDVELLNNTNWLNDNIIAFWFEYLENDIYKDYKDVLGFICPQVVQYLKYALPEEVKSTVEGLELNKKQYIFFPVNDCRALTIPGGTHWSLLVYKVRENVFQHYDSYSCSCNLTAAEHLAQVLYPFLRDSSNGAQSLTLQEMVCTQQNNTYDCGMHVICNTDGLCKKFIFNDARPVTEIVPLSLVATSRGALKDIIYSLKK